MSKFGSIKIDKESLRKAQQEATRNVVRLDKALGLTYPTVKNGYVYFVSAEGAAKKIKKATFGLRKINKRTIFLKDG